MIFMISRWLKNSFGCHSEPQCGEESCPKLLSSLNLLIRLDPSLALRMTFGESFSILLVMVITRQESPRWVPVVAPCGEPCWPRGRKVKLDVPGLPLDRHDAVPARPPTASSGRGERI
ncbi:MAG: hypothetical protein COV67_14175 [Nitrospinae bacterium CG11_big_fil_rev_8_21_14_0_20_56_8]|nr:MAG: hypothetical protein COV67_14175 [Nitrospinae bacterium CG11_big_fil_rev_8_21_14_0_20_56_8]